MLKLGIIGLNNFICSECKFRENCINGIIRCDPFGVPVLRYRNIQYIRPDVTYGKISLEEYLI